MVARPLSRLPRILQNRQYWSNLPLTRLISKKRSCPSGSINIWSSASTYWTGRVSIYLLFFVCLPFPSEQFSHTAPNVCNNAEEGTSPCGPVITLEKDIETTCRVAKNLTIAYFSTRNRTPPFHCLLFGSMAKLLKMLNCKDDDAGKLNFYSIALPSPSIPHPIASRHECRSQQVIEHLQTFFQGK